MRTAGKFRRIQVLTARLDVEHFDSASEALEALQKLNADPHDVVLVDIDPAEFSDDDSSHQLKNGEYPLPPNVFLTVDGSPATLEKQTADYVPLVLSENETEVALLGAPRGAQNMPAAKLMDALAQLQKLPRVRNSRIAIKANGRILFIDPGDVVAVEAEGNYVRLRRSADSHLLRESISAMEETLRPYGFIRIHRSVVVNTLLVEGIKPYPTGEYGLQVKGGKEYTVTRTYKKNLKSLAEFWIGTETFLSD